MSSHPHSASKLLPTFSSSASSASSDHHKLTRGSCTGLLFQLFDWNSRLQKKQLFRHKSLPAERPAGLMPKKLFCCKEKLPSAEMPNTSYEASTPCDQEGQSEDALKTEQTPEKKRKKRSPNVVAKLMGLETMPSPDLRREKWPIHYQHSTQIQNFAEKSFVLNSRVPSSRRSLMEIDKGAKSNCSSRWGFSAEPFSRDSSHIQHDERVVHDEARCQALRTYQGPARKVFTNVASAQSSADAKNGVFGRVLSSSNTHNKNNLPVQSDSASNTTMPKVANRALEHNMQPRHALVRLVESNAVGNDNGKENVKKTTHRQSSSSKEHCDSSRPHPDRAFKQDRKIAAAANLPAASSLHAANRQSLSSAANMNIKEDAAVQKLKQHQIKKDDKESAKCPNSQQSAESSMENKEMPHTKRLDNTRRHLNEANGIELQSRKLPPVKLEMDPSSSKTTAPHYESQEPSSASSILSTITQSKSVNSSHDLSKQRRISSCGKAKVYKENKLKSDEGETNMKLPYTRGAGVVGSDRSILRGRIRASKCKTVGNKAPVELRQEDPSKNSCISKDPIQESGFTEQDTARCNDVSHENVDMVQKLDNVLDEIALSEIVHESHESQIEAIREDSAFATSAEITRMDFDTLEISSNNSMAQNICHSSCNSSLEDVRDTASSCDIHSAHRKKQTVSYSGKSTATILQELLSALNSSARLPILENERIQQEYEVSGVTSTTIKGTEDALNTSSSCIEEQDFNSLALSPLASNACSQISAKDFGCNIEGWQSSPTSSLVSPSNNLQCISSDSRESLRDCWHVYSKCMHSSTKDVPRGTEQIIQSEEDYVDSIVRTAKLPRNDMFSSKLKADDSILDPALFHKLEKMISYNWKWREESKVEGEAFDTTITELVYHDEDAARDYRKLMFDSVQEALSLDAGLGEYLPQEAWCKRVLIRIHDWKGVRCGLNVDDMVENAMNTGAGKWVDFSCEHGDIAQEVGASIYNDLVDELVHDLVYCPQTVPDPRGGKKARSGRMERKKLIWVGL